MSQRLDLWPITYQDQKKRGFLTLTPHSGLVWHIFFSQVLSMYESNTYWSAVFYLSPMGYCNVEEAFIYDHCCEVATYQDWNYFERARKKGSGEMEEYQSSLLCLCCISPHATFWIALIKVSLALAKHQLSTNYKLLVEDWVPKQSALIAKQRTKLNSLQSVARWFHDGAWSSLKLSTLQSMIQTPTKFAYQYWPLVNQSSKEKGCHSVCVFLFVCSLITPNKLKLYTSTILTLTFPLCFSRMKVNGLPKLQTTRIYIKIKSQHLRKKNKLDMNSI